MTKPSFQEQAVGIGYCSAIFVKNIGGSTTSAFLPNEASVLFHHTPKDMFGHCTYYETLSYLQTVWIPLEDYNNTANLMGVSDAPLEAISPIYIDFSYV